MTERRRDRRQLILQTAAELFVQQGYQQTSMQQIADAVGLLKGSLYHHYQSKQEILFEITREPLETLVEEVTTIAKSEVSPPEKITQAIRSHMAAFDRFHPHLMVVTAETDESLPEGVRETITGLRREYQRVWEDIVVTGERQHVLAFPGSAAVLVNLVLGSVNWMHRWYEPDGPLGAQEIATLLSAMVLRGIEVDGHAAQT